MDNLRIYFNNFRNSLNYKSSKERMDVTRFYSLSSLRWVAMLFCFFTPQELKQLPKRSGHPNADKL